MSIMKHAAQKYLGALLACAVVTSLMTGIAWAAPKQIGKNGDWTVYVDEEGGKTCFISSHPTSQNPKNLSWTAVFYVTRGASTNGRNEPSVQVTYTYQEDSQATVSIGSDTFTLFTDKDGAWIQDAEQERKLIDAMKAGVTMIVKGTSSRGNLTTDTFSLSGVTAGVKALEGACP